MKKITVRNVLAMSISLAMVHALAAPAMIGIATARGSFRVDDSNVAGNATLFAGATVETGITTGELSLLGTSKVALDSGTRARVYQDHLVLDRGKVQWSGALLRMQAGLLQVVGADSGSTSIVVRRGNSIVVGALTGNVKVLAANGSLVRTISTGSAFSFGQEQTKPEPTTATEEDTTKKDGDGKKKAAGAAAGAAGAAGAAAAGGTGLATGAIVAIGVGVAAAVAIPVAVIATRDNTPATTSR